MAIKAFCEKLMAINDGPSLMDHHRHVWSECFENKFLFFYSTMTGHSDRVGSLSWNEVQKYILISKVTSRL